MGFLASLVFTYRAMDRAEREAEDRLKAAQEGKVPVERGLFRRSKSWDTAAWVAFMLAVLLAAWQLGEVTADSPPAS